MQLVYFKNMSSKTNDKVSTGKIVLCTLIVFLALITLPTIIIKAIPILFFSGLASLFVGCALFVIIGASYKEHKNPRNFVKSF